jgi:hypothetical protein
MRRLEYTRPMRSCSLQARSATDAVMALARAARERTRLDQERVTLEKRIHHIRVRLNEISETEIRLLPMVQQLAGRKALDGAAAGSSRHGVLPPGGSTASLQY